MGQGKARQGRGRGRARAGRAGQGSYFHYRTYLKNYNLFEKEKRKKT